MSSKMLVHYVISCTCTKMVQKKFVRERAAIKRMIETGPILKPYFKAFVFEIDAPASEKTTQQVYLKEIEKSE